MSAGGYPSVVTEQQMIGFVDLKGTFATNNLTITPASGQQIMLQPANETMIFRLILIMIAQPVRMDRIRLEVLLMYRSQFMPQADAMGLLSFFPFMGSVMITPDGQEWLKTGC